MPDLMSWERHSLPAVSPTKDSVAKPKVLLNVIVLGIVDAVQVLVSPESNVGDSISAGLNQYLKEGRRHMLSGSAIDDFDLHYSQFSLENTKIELSGFGEVDLCGSYGRHWRPNSSTSGADKLEEAHLLSGKNLLKLRRSELRIEPLNQKLEELERESATSIQPTSVVYL